MRFLSRRERLFMPKKIDPQCKVDMQPREFDNGSDSEC